MENVEINTHLPQQASDKTLAIVAYITLIGWIVAFILNRDKKDPLVAFHVRQMLGILLSGAAVSIVAVIPILGWIAYLPLLVCVIVIWVSGLINAINGVQKPALILGKKYDEWFKSL